jgi:hypothetical protein
MDGILTDIDRLSLLYPGDIVEKIDLNQRGESQRRVREGTRIMLMGMIGGICKPVTEFNYCLDDIPYISGVNHFVAGYCNEPIR